MLVCLIVAAKTEQKNTEEGTWRENCCNSGTTLKTVKSLFYSKKNLKFEFTHEVLESISTTLTWLIILLKE
jgi:hypothetical protein